MLLALVATVAIVAIGSAQAPVTWTGEWSTTYGKMTLSQTGASVEGNYEHDQGHLTGTVSGSTLSGTWDEAPTRAPPYDKGDFEFTLNADPKSFNGRWRNVGDVDWRGGWTGMCTAGPCLQNGATTTTPTPTPALPPVTPRSALPQVGTLTSYLAPRALGNVVLGAPKFDPSVGSAAVDVGLTRGSGRNVDDPGFIAAVEPSAANIERAAKLCLLLVFQDIPLEIYDEAREFARCASVVSRILQRAEELRKRRKTPTAASAQ
ncbi:MAG: hypothetical protein ACRDK0_07815, partial [Solirubrobacteraceae bacterium]